MGKLRYVDVDRWEDSFFLELSLAAKLFYSYLADKCDSGGVYERSPRMERTRIGDLDFDALFDELGDRIEKLENGKLWLTRYIKVQLNGKPLRPDRIPAHADMVRKLDAAGISLENPWIVRATGVKRETPMPSPKKDKAEEKPNLPGLNAPTIPLALDCREFHETWDLWLKYRRERKLPVLKPTSIKAQLDELATWGLERAIGAIKHSIRQNWQGIFEEKSTNGKPNDDRNRSSRSFERAGDYSGVKEK